MTWPAIAPVAASSLLVVPLGSTEQHGPHLPFSTDTDVAVALVEGFASRRDDVIVAPALSYGSSGEHAAFAGTLSIGAAALEQVVVELVRSADAFGGVVLVSGHGGNAQSLAAAVATVRREGRRVLAWAPRIQGGDAHAGRTETSLMLSVRPSSVSTVDRQRAERWERGDTRPIDELLPLLRERGVAGISPNGVLGDSEGASAEEGAALLADLVGDLSRAVQAWCR